MMTKSLEIQLQRIGELLKSAEATQISAAGILAYAEDRLDAEETRLFEAAILDDPELVAEVNMLRMLVAARPVKSPPPDLHTSLIHSLGLHKSYVMNLVLKKIRQTMKIMKGTEHYLPDMGKSLVPTRGNSDEVYVFRSELEQYQVTCQIQSSTDSQYIHFTVEDDDGMSVRNCRFSICQDGHILHEIITDTAGFTNVKQLLPGDYEISIAVGRRILGDIKLNLS